MGILRVISPDRTIADLAYPEREPPLATLQRACGGYVEHVPVTYEGKRRSSYVVDPFSRHPTYGFPDRTPNPMATDIVGSLIVGPLVIDMKGG